MSNELIALLVSLAVITALSVINGMLRYHGRHPGMVAGLDAALDRLSFNTRKDSPDTVKAIGFRSRPPEPCEPPKNGEKYSKSIPPVAALALLSLVASASACAPGWRERVADRADNFGAAIGPSLEECGALKPEAIGNAVAAGIELATAAAAGDLGAFGRGLVAAFGRAEVRCAVARVVERTRRGEEAERGAPAGGGETTHRAAVSDETLARARWMRDNLGAWDTPR